MKATDLAEWRELVLDRDNYTCQECGNREQIEAHHIKQKSQYPELELEVDNGWTVCHNCHKGIPVEINHFRPSGVRWFPSGHPELLGKRKIIKVGNSRAVIIPASWLKYHEDKHGEVIEILMELNNVITLTVEERTTPLKQLE